MISPFNPVTSSEAETVDGQNKEHAVAAPTVLKEFTKISFKIDKVEENQQLSTNLEREIGRKYEAFQTEFRLKFGTITSSRN